MILAVDSSTSWLGICLYEEPLVLYEQTWKTKRRHTVELAPVVAAAMKECGVSIDQLKGLAIALGPGSFTSLRIGLVFIKGLAFACHLPVVGIPTLDCLAYSQPISDKPLVCVLQAGRGKLAAAEYHTDGQQWVCENPCRVLTARELVAQIESPTLVCGELDAEERRTLARKWKSVLLTSPAKSMRRPAFLAELACQRFNAGKTDDPVTLSPFYLHTADPILS